MLQRAGLNLGIDELILLVMIITMAIVAAVLVYKYKRTPKKILTRLVATNIVLDIVAIVMWLFPETHWSVYRLGYVAAIVEAGLAAAIFAATLYGLKKQKTWAPKLAIATTIAQRIFATYIFFPSTALILTLIWSLTIIVFGYLTLKTQN
jgi:hypothetical protein